MNILNSLIQNNRLKDPDDIDALLDIADLTRQFIHDSNYESINDMIVYTIENSLYEAFIWIMTLLQEEFEKTDGYKLSDFECEIGGSIPDYDGFADRLQVDFNAQKGDVESVYDEQGEVESFFNNITYKTGYEHIDLISSENFDTKDNDYIRYKLVFRRRI